jgi:hypothetical protein
MRWLVFTALCLSCKGKQVAPKHDDARLPPADAAVPDGAIDAAVPDAAAMSLTITSDGVGPITAKATDEDRFKKLLPGFTITSNHQEAEDYSYEEIIASKGGMPILRAVISDESLFKVEVEEPMFSTAAGVSVGMTVAELAERNTDIKCVFETYDPQADAERIDRALRCQSASLPHVLFEIDYEKFTGREGSVSPKAIAKRKIIQIVWLAAKE